MSQKFSRRRFLVLGSIPAFSTAIGGVAWGQGESSGAIDVHAHFPLEALGSALAGRVTSSRDENEAELVEAVKASDFSALANYRIRRMDAMGVAKTVLMPIDFSFGAEADRHWEEAEGIAAIARTRPDRLIPFFACDPRRPDAIALLKRAKAEQGVKGVKIHPLAGFAADDRDAAYPFYKACSELELPILGHCRPIGMAERDDLSRPERYGNVARDFPELKVCLGHFGGGPWSDAALAVMEKYDNAYGDISTMQRDIVENAEKIGTLFRRAMDGPARTRLMYGTDWPTVRQFDAEAKEILDRGIAKADGGRFLDAEEVGLLMRENAAGYLGI